MRHLVANFKNLLPIFNWTNDINLLVTDAKGAGGDTEKCAPCVRLIVRDTETDSKRVKAGQLHIVTVDGGTIGREGDHSVLLTEVDVSRLHARISYDENNQTYSVKDCGSRNGTWLDGEKIEASGDPKQMKHGSVLKIGTISLTCHIHEGKRTCGHCEPGLLAQVSVLKISPILHRT